MTRKQEQGTEKCDAGKWRKPKSRWVIELVTALPTGTHVPLGPSEEWAEHTSRSAHGNALTLPGWAGLSVSGSLQASYTVTPEGLGQKARAVWDS